MRISVNFNLPLAALLFAVVFTPNVSWAHTNKNCPTEPTQGVSIVSGLTYSGTNCRINSTGDLDEFVFTASAGDTWRVVVGLGASPTTNAVLSLYAPGSTTPLVSTSTNIAFGAVSAGFTQKLTTAGTYTIAVTEASNATITYGLSLEQIMPAAPDSIPLILNKNPAYSISPPTAQNAFTFYGTTADTYKLTASVPSGPVDNVCFEVYQPDGTIVTGPDCTNIAFGALTVSAQVTPKQKGTHVMVLHSGSNDTTQGYNVELACLLGADGCKQPTPKCILSDNPSYNATTGTLTMTFTLGTPVAVTWNGWLTSQNTMTSLWSQARSITEPTVIVTKTKAGVGKSGNVGILSTFTIPTSTTTTGGITCNSWVLVNTGKP
jgi:hypothetical protein